MNAIDDDGFNHLIYSVSWSSIEYRKVNQDGQTIIGPLTIPSGDMSHYSSGDMEIDRDGKIHVVFDGRTQNEPEHNIFYSQLRIDGSLVISTRKVTNTTDWSSRVKMDLDNQGNAYIVWREKSTPPSIYWSNLSANGYITGPTIMVSGEVDTRGEVDNPEISVDTQGDSHILWQQKDDGSSHWEIHYSKISTTGNELVAPVSVISSPENDLVQAEAMMDEKHDLHIVYNERSAEQVTIMYAVVGDDGVLQDTITVFETGTIVLIRPSIVLTSHGDKIFLFGEFHGTNDDKTRIMIRILASDNNAWLTFILTDFEDFIYRSYMAYGDDHAIVHFIRNEDIFQILLDTSLANYPPTPVLTYEPSSPLLDDVISFFGDASEDPDDNDDVREYLFDWGDGNSTGWQMSPEADYQFTKAGTFRISLYVRDNHGLSCEAPANVTIVIEKPDIVSYDQSFTYIIIIVIISVLILAGALISRNRD